MSSTFFYFEETKSHQAICFRNLLVQTVQALRLPIAQNKQNKIRQKQKTKQKQKQKKKDSKKKKKKKQTNKKKSNHVFRILMLFYF